MKHRMLTIATLLMVVSVLSLIITACNNSKAGDNSEDYRNDQTIDNSADDLNDLTANNTADVLNDLTADKETSLEDFEWEEVTGGIKIKGYKGSSKEVVVPEIIVNKKVTEIDSTAFSGNIVIESLTLPEGVDSIHYSIFKNCENLKSLTCLGATSFYGRLESLKSLIELNLPKAKEISIDQLPQTIERLYMPNIDALLTDLFSSDTVKWWKENKITEITIPEELPLYYREKIVEGESEKVVWQILYSTPEDKEYNDSRVNNYDSSNIVDPDGRHYDSYKSLQYNPVLESDKGRIFCSFFGKDEIIINGVKYAK